MPNVYYVAQEINHIFCYSWFLDECFKLIKTQVFNHLCAVYVIQILKGLRLRIVHFLGKLQVKRLPQELQNINFC